MFKFNLLLRAEENSLTLIESGETSLRL